MNASSTEMLQPSLVAGAACSPMTEETGRAILEELRKLTASQERVLPVHPMTPAEFAKIVGKSEKTVRRWILKGKLKATVVGHVILISPVAAQKFLGNGLEAGR